MRCPQVVGAPNQVRQRVASGAAPRSVGLAAKLLLMQSLRFFVPPCVK